MRTLTSGKGKVHHIPAREDIAPENPRGLTTFLCGRSTIEGKTNPSSTPTCKGCLGKLRVDEFEAYYERQRRAQRAEDAAAYEALAKRQAEELAARKAAVVRPTVHVVELAPLTSYGADHWTSDDRADDTPRTVYRMHSRYGRGTMRFSIMYVGPEGEARRVHQGPIIPGPYCALIPLSSVISAWAGPKERYVEVQEGDVLILNGLPMILIDDDALGYPHAVSVAEYGARMAARVVRGLADAASTERDQAERVGDETKAERLKARRWALLDGVKAIKEMWQDGPTVLPYSAMPEPKPEVPEFHEHVLNLDDGDRLRVLGSETLGGEPGVWVQRIHGDTGYAAEKDWWPLKYLIQDGATAYAPFRSHLLERTDGRLYEVLGSETDAITGLRGVWMNPTEDDHPRWVAEDILLRNFHAPSR